METNQRFSVVTGSESKTTKERGVNEDALVVTREGHFGVLDGISGKEGGEIAAQVAQEIFENRLNDFSINSGEFEAKRLLEEAFEEADRRVRFLAPRESGVTVAAAVFIDGGKKAVIGNKGDCRIYLYRGKTLEQITKDHGRLNDMINNGQLTAERAKEIDQAEETFPTKEDNEIFGARNQVYRFVGGSQEEDPDIFVVALKPGDRIIGITDGVSDNLIEEEIEKIAGENLNPKQIAMRLVQAASQRSLEGHFRSKRDDITAVVTEVSGSSQKERPTIGSSAYFSELFESLKDKRKVASSDGSRSYTVGSIIDAIKGYVNKECGENAITRSENIRAKVNELVGKAVKRGGNPTIETAQSLLELEYAVLRRSSFNKDGVETKPEEVLKTIYDIATGEEGISINDLPEEIQKKKDLIRY